MKVRLVITLLSSARLADVPSPASVKGSLRKAFYYASIEMGEDCCASSLGKGRCLTQELFGDRDKEGAFSISKCKAVPGGAMRVVRRRGRVSSSLGVGLEDTFVERSFAFGSTFECVGEINAKLLSERAGTESLKKIIEVLRSEELIKAFLYTGIGGSPALLEVYVDEAILD